VKIPVRSRLLGPLTTLGIGGRAEVIELSDMRDFRAVVAYARARGTRPVCLGLGSNVLVADSGLEAPVLRMTTRGITVRSWRRMDRVLLTVEAGHPLPDLVDFALAEGLVGMETLAGIPGTVGAMPVQNVGAYGQDTAGSLVSVSAWDWWQQRRAVMTARECRLGHRRSVFKRSSRWTILRVTFALTRSRLSRPVHYRELADALAVPPGTRLAASDVVAAVLAIRRRKGMVLDIGDPDTRSAGSLFVSPVLRADQATHLRRAGASVHRHPDGTTRVGPGWLMHAAGFRLNQAMGPGVRLSGKHYTLVTDGMATSASFARAAATLRERVRQHTGIEMTAEPDLLGDDPGYAELCRPRAAGTSRVACAGGHQWRPPAYVVD